MSLTKLFLAITLTVITAGGCSMSNNTLPVSKEIQDVILEDAVRRTSIPKDHIDLHMLKDWDNQTCPIVEAMPDAHGANPRRYAVINNEVLAANKKDTFQKIIAACYPDLAKVHPVDLARLATMFAHFGAPVGMVWARNLAEDHPEITTPTKEFQPVFKDVDGQKVLEFYSFSAPLSQFFFCQVFLGGVAPELKATQLN